MARVGVQQLSLRATMMTPIYKIHAWKYSVDVPRENLCRRISFRTEGLQLVFLAIASIFHKSEVLVVGACCALALNMCLYLLLQLIKAVHSNSAERFSRVKLCMERCAVLQAMP